MSADRCAAPNHPYRAGGAFVVAAPLIGTGFPNSSNDDNRNADHATPPIPPTGSRLPRAAHPLFHVGATIAPRVAHDLFAQAARVLRPGGELWAVWNSHLRYRPVLERVVGPTRQVGRDPKSTVTASVRG